MKDGWRRFLSWRAGCTGVAASGKLSRAAKVTPLKMQSMIEYRFGEGEPPSIKTEQAYDMKRKTLLLVIVGFLLVCGVGLWGYLWNDFDFQRPASPLRCPTPPKETPYRFIAFGDYGQGTPFQYQLAEIMGSVRKRFPYHTALLLGDNIYPDGDIRRLGKTHFEAPYQTLIQNHVRFLAIIGDHDDRRGHLTDQLAYFKMPGRYYQVSEGPVDFFMLNTTRFVRSPEQQAWLLRALSESRARWKIVAGHHPLYSSGRNGNTEGLRHILEPLMIRYGVNLYLAGHDHDYERFAPIDDVHYIVSGGGGSFLYDFRDVKPHSQVRLKTHHFLLFEVYSDRLDLKAFNRYGDIIDCVSWER